MKFIAWYDNFCENNQDISEYDSELGWNACKQE